jgi:hypothetical protein
MRRQRSKIIWMALGAVALAGLFAVLVGVTASRSSPPELPAWVSDAAIHVAKSLDGGVMPSSGEYALTNADAAAPAVGLTSGDAAEAQRQVYLVVLHGNFVDNNGWEPLGSLSPAKGDTLVLRFDIATEKATDEGIGPGPVDTSAVGPLTPMPLN